MTERNAMIDTVVFDLGGVLIDWNPRYLYRQLFDDEAAMEHFLTKICTGPGTSSRMRVARGARRSPGSARSIPRTRR